MARRTYLRHDHLGFGFECRQHAFRRRACVTYAVMMLSLQPQNAHLGGVGKHVFPHQRLQENIVIGASSESPQPHSKRRVPVDITWSASPQTAAPLRVQVELHATLFELVEFIRMRFSPVFCDAYGGIALTLTSRRSDGTTAKRATVYWTAAEAGTVTSGLGQGNAASSAPVGAAADSCSLRMSIRNLLTLVDMERVEKGMFMRPGPVAALLDVVVCTGIERNESFVRDALHKWEEDARSDIGTACRRASTCVVKFAIHPFDLAEWAVLAKRDDTDAHTERLVVGALIACLGGVSIQRVEEEVKRVSSTTGSAAAWSNSTAELDWISFVSDALRRSAKIPGDPVMVQDDALLRVQEISVFDVSLEDHLWRCEWYARLCQLLHTISVSNSFEAAHRDDCRSHRRVPGISVTVQTNDGEASLVDLGLEELQHSWKWCCREVLLSPSPLQCAKMLLSARVHLARLRVRQRSYISPSIVNGGGGEWVDLSEAEDFVDAFSRNANCTVRTCPLRQPTQLLSADVMSPLMAALAAFDVWLQAHRQSYLRLHHLSGTARSGDGALDNVVDETHALLGYFVSSLGFVTVSRKGSARLPLTRWQETQAAPCGLHEAHSEWCRSTRHTAETALHVCHFLASLEAHGLVGHVRYPGTPISVQVKLLCLDVLRRAGM